MTDRTENGISRRGILSVIYCLPGLYAVAHSVFRRPALVEARALLVLALGGFGALVLACTTLLPALLRRVGQVDRAALWRLSAFRGIGFSTLWTFTWTMLFVPWGAPALRLAAGLAGSAASLAILWWADRRWLHLGLFKWRWNEEEANGR